jgi:hypothetical protein
LDGGSVGGCGGALEPVVEEIEPVGMQSCLPLHCHRPQHCDQVVN